MAGSLPRAGCACDLDFDLCRDECECDREESLRLWLFGDAGGQVMAVGALLFYCEHALLFYCEHALLFYCEHALLFNRLYYVSLFR
jgi:hypothetical protein